MDAREAKNPLLGGEATQAAPEPPVATVASLMPTAPPLPAGLAPAPAPSANWFPQEQLAILDAQPYDGGAVPEAVAVAGSPGAPAVATAVPVATTTTTPPGAGGAAAGAPGVVTTTAEGVPIYAVSSVSRAAWRRGNKGEVKSNDAMLATRDEILLFLNQHAASSKPSIAVRVHGYHHETEVVTRERTNNHGDRRTEVSERRRRVDDFDYLVDVSDFVYPFGYLYSEDVAAARDNGGRATVADLVDRYCASTNKLKTIHARKVVECFDWDYLCRAVADHVRRLGWMLELDVSIQWRDDSVRIYDKNLLSAAWENPCLYCLMHLTVVPCVALRAYRGDFTTCCGPPSHRITALKAAFRMPYHPQQVMDVIRPLLWCPGWAGAQAAMVLLNNALTLGIVAATGGTHHGRRHRRHGRRW